MPGKQYRLDWIYEYDHGVWAIAIAVKIYGIAIQVGPFIFGIELVREI